jgi:hypothetical protein
MAAHGVRQEIPVGGNYHEYLADHIVPHIWFYPYSRISVRFPSEAKSAAWEFPLDFFINRHTEAREML